MLTKQSHNDYGTSTRSSPVVVPPFLASLNGPLLGPALLAGAARDAGFAVSVLDLNASYLTEHFPDLCQEAPSAFLGDHDKPIAKVKAARKCFEARLLPHLPDPPATATHEVLRKPALELPYQHDDVNAAALSIARSDLGEWIRGKLWQETPPLAVFLSIMASGQVLMGLSIAVVAKQLWPGVPVIMGGAHATGLRDEIIRDAGYGVWIDRFVFGYAERSFVAILDALARGVALPAECAIAGQGGAVVYAREDAGTRPLFETPRRFYHWPRLTLPAQLSRGCAYGRCAYCTYPGIEGEFRSAPPALLPWFKEEAERHHAALSFKDSLFLPKSLHAAAASIAGRVQWSATTKLNGGVDAREYRFWAEGGCATLEFGIETLSPVAQRLIEKKQPLGMFLRALDALAGSGINVVINYIVGFPTMPRSQEQTWLERLQHELAIRRGELTSLLQLQEFALERLAPMAKHPERFGIVLGEVRWPWSSDLSWTDAAPAGALCSDDDVEEDWSEWAAQPTAPRTP